MPTANGDRVVQNLRQLAELGKYKAGVHRPSLSPQHVQSLQWLKVELGALGHETVIDGIGNVFGF